MSNSRSMPYISGKLENDFTVPLTHGEITTLPHTFKGAASICLIPKNEEDLPEGFEPTLGPNAVLCLDLYLLGDKEPSAWPIVAQGAVQSYGPTWTPRSVYEITDSALNQEILTYYRLFWQSGKLNF